MVFSTPVFLWLFLPATLAVYFLSGRLLRNGILLAASLFFYAWGEDEYVLILIISILMNYAVGRWIGPTQGRMRLIALWTGVVGNLLLLAYFKYTGFLLDSLNVASAQEIAPALPIGISFFTFQALSYLVDLYFHRVAMQRNPFNLALYISRSSRSSLQAPSSATLKSKPCSRTAPLTAATCRLEWSASCAGSPRKRSLQTRWDWWPIRSMRFQPEV